jgi:hypothetical protein
MLSTVLEKISQLYETASQIFIENIQEPMDKQPYVLGLFFLPMM